MKRFLIGLLCLITLVALVAGTAYVVHGLRARPAVEAAKDQAAADITAGLPGALQQADRDRDEVLAQVSTRFGDPTYDWQELVCELDSRDAGWIVEDWSQRCRVRTVALIPVATTPDGPVGACEEIDTRHLDLEDGLEYSTQISHVTGTAIARQEDGHWMSCPLDVLDPAGARVTLSGSRPEDLEGSPAWIMVELHNNVSESPLGCSPWGVLFCNAPGGTPVLVDVDQN